MLKLNFTALLQLIFLSSMIREISSDVLIYSVETHTLEVQFKDVPSRFGASIPFDGIRGFVVYSDPPTACTPIQGPPINEHNYIGKWVVLIKRYDCQFEDKIRHAQMAGYHAAIVHNVNSSSLEPMAADNPSGITIPSIFIGSESGALIKENYLFTDGYYVVINDFIPYNFTSFLWLFSVLAGLCFFLMILFLLIRYLNERRRQRRHRLPKSSLKEIPIHKFKKNDPYEMCAICLEEYVENDKLRVLPCSHAYHSKCIDPWLTKNRRVCPVCKRRVFASGEVNVETDSDTDDETSPLVRNTPQTTNAGTFRPRTRSLQADRIRSIQAITSSRSSSSTSSASFGSTTDHLSKFLDIYRNLLEQPSINASEAVEITSESNHVEDVHTRDVHTGDVHTEDVHTEDVHIGDFHAEDVHTDVHTEDLHTHDFHTDDVHIDFLD